jgi:O-antigen ligase
MLWRAAWQLFKERPLVGIGPDNFRLRYGEALGYPRWDGNVRVNNLYLEVLVGSGVLGIAALGLMLAAIRWHVQLVTASVLIFLAHGMVDVFLMTTPIYFSFWILVGQLHAHRV